MLLIMLTVLWGWWKNRWAAGVQGSIPEQVRNYKEVWKGTSSSPIWGLLWASVTVTSETSLRELGSRSLRAHLKDSCPLIEEEKLKIKTTIPQTSRHYLPENGEKDEIRGYLMDFIVFLQLWSPLRMLHLSVGLLTVSECRPSLSFSNL